MHPLVRVDSSFEDSGGWVKKDRPTNLELDTIGAQKRNHLLAGAGRHCGNLREWR